MKPLVKKFLANYDAKTMSINRLLVSSYLRFQNIEIDDGSLLEPYIIHEKDNDWEASKTFYNILRKEYPILDLEVLMKFFEFVVSPSDKVVTGAIYTPLYIRNIIVDYVFTLINGRDFDTIKIADIACGCGGFFLTVCEKLLKETDLNCHFILSHIIYGCDIENYCIERTKIILTLKALELGERTNDLTFNLYIGNSLSFDWNKIITNFCGFDAVVGNPPYVTSSKIPKESKALLEHWEVCKSGKADLYIPFFQIAIELLNQQGVMGYITVGNFYRSLNGRALRGYFAKNHLNLTIVDFAGEQVFKGCSTYTCLCFINKQQNGEVRYTKRKSRNINSVSDLHFVIAEYDNLDNIRGWVIKDNGISQILRKIEQTGIQLVDTVKISNGLATLKNDIYVLKVVNQNRKEFIHEYKGVEYSIEKNICRQVVKPSSMNSFLPVKKQIRQIIFPYVEKNGKVQCLNETDLNLRFPHAYDYLKELRNILDYRDKGSRNYEQWFAYGRSQAINISGFRLLMPYIAEKPTFFLSNIKDLLFYNGFAIIDNNLKRLERIQKVLTTDIFWFYVMNISKPYANGYYSMGKRYIKHFGIPNFTPAQYVILDSLTQKEDIEQFLYPLYFGNRVEEVKSIIDDYLITN